ncbi:MAG: 5-methyltetrahydropteroyltriglutamate--homocysteine S-methyltransferase [Alcaligenaceae bacterium]|nr:5-methyltetrahydropteroyltriglutamate--homocysteine S-methyltransferase [Alcaligenaceae bacterium]
MSNIHNLGLPRIGADRELKKALESFWAGNSSEESLLETGKQLRERHWQAQKAENFVCVGDFAWYDHILEWSCTLGVIPKRFQGLEKNKTIGLRTLFAMARGIQGDDFQAPACEMTKWFDTNYHYIVPELEENQMFSLSRDFFFEQIKEAQALGHKVKPIIPGPITYLALSKGEGLTAGTDSDDKLVLLPALVVAYVEVFAKLKELGIEWVQIDEPVATLNLEPSWQEALLDSHKILAEQGLKTLVATYFESPEPNKAFLLEFATQGPHGLHIDLTRGELDLDGFVRAWPKDKVLSLGVISGREIWRTDLEKVLERISPSAHLLGDNLWLAPSSSLLHVPYDVNLEQKLNKDVKQHLSFALQKIDELQLLASKLESVQLGQALSVKQQAVWEQQAATIENRRQSTQIHNPAVQQRLKEVDKIKLKRPTYEIRAEAQRKRLNLPAFPTTTIGSFPQTAEIRQLRREWKQGKSSDRAYEEGIKEQIKDAIQRQEKLGIDVLVHGEAERNDMVEYFGELLGGFAFTEHGWVQSYGSRCVKPPIIYGDVSRLMPMTVSWSQYAQSLSDKYVKGMLTGPVTLLEWSFVRDDQPRAETCRQLALALRDEILDLEKAGIKIIQIDEPAIREGLPLRKENWEQYLRWAVDCFLLATSGVANDTQIHTHMCYSEFNDIIESIAELDADVITIETSRSNMDLLDAFEAFHYPNDIGPGVYDIHSPNIPEKDWMVQLLEKASQKIPAERIWVNPDCGLKTRHWPEVEAALELMVAAAKELRTRFQ